MTGPTAANSNIEEGLLDVADRAAATTWHRLASRYREQLKEAVLRTVSHAWQALLGVSVQTVSLQRMKTRWGSCNLRTGTIRLNTDLAKKPPGCLEYLVVHEMIHLIEPTHSARFVALMDGAMPTIAHRA